MPSQSTSFPYDRLSEPSADADSVAVMSSSNNSFENPVNNTRNRSDSFQTPFAQGIFNTWLGDTIQSPTSPTSTDQLLKGDDSHTITSTLASLGLDDADRLQQLYRPSLHTSQSYSSLVSTDNSQQSTEWLQQNYHQQQQQQYYHHQANIHGLPPSSTSASGPANSSPTNEMKFRSNASPNVNHQHASYHLLRPRATSMSIAEDQDGLYSSSLSSASDSPRMVRSAMWPPHVYRHQQQRPYLRLSNSSADLIETMARQRMPIPDVSGPNEKTYSIDDGALDDLSYDPAKIANSTSQTPTPTPTRSLWIGNLDITWTLDDLTALFTSFGHIENIRLLPDRECAFINFTFVEDAIKAKEVVTNQMNGSLGSSMVRIGFGKPDSQLTLAPEFGNVQGPTRALWIGNLPILTTPTALFNLFSTFGQIESVRILNHKNCGFVNFTTQEDAIRAKKALQTKEIMGPGSGPVRIGFAKAPSIKSTGKTQQQQQQQQQHHQQWHQQHQHEDGSSFIGVDNTALENVISSGSLPNGTFLDGNINNSSPSLYMSPSTPPPTNNSNWQAPSIFGSNNTGGTTMITTKSFSTGSNNDGHPDQNADSQMMYYMMNGMIGDHPTNMLTSVAAERQYIMKELGDDESDGGLFEGLHMTLTYYSTISPAPELGQQRNMDVARLRDIRKKLDNGSHISLQEVEAIAMECLGDLVELCSDYIGNTVVQRLFERCSEPTKSMMLDVVAPHIASIGVHKNGTWAAQRIVDTAKLPLQINVVCKHIQPYVPALLLDQFGNYVVQCCLALGPDINQFIFHAIVDNCWEIAQGRFGSRAVRATLESPHVTRQQQKYVAATLIQHALLLATNANGALLLIWLLDTSGINGRYRVLGPRLIPHLSGLCTHKLASLTVLKLINQRHEPEARQQILDTIFFSPHEQVLHDILMDQVHGVNLIQKILSSSYVDLRERQRIADRVKQMLAKNKLLHIQGYKRLLEEINMVLVDSNPGPSLAATLPGLMMPPASTATWMNQEWVALHAHYISAATAVMQQHQQQEQQQKLNMTTIDMHESKSLLSTMHADKDADASVSPNHHPSDTALGLHGPSPPATSKPPLTNMDHSSLLALSSSSSTSSSSNTPLNTDSSETPGTC
ncbi:hypothetical protein BCR42DRAFT_207817 [Absidia repens]|uniref:Armadillo-type protein n=1 Tax=Absidia repens TaxID=90262 RepID=A0A1X2IQA1_9FUNG|nr:hypothetical protein BCR42DRAFT_207817 [Absidia repens]